MGVQVAGVQGAGCRVQDSGEGFMRRVQENWGVSARAA